MAFLQEMMVQSLLGNQHGMDLTSLHLCYALPFPHNCQLRPSLRYDCHMCMGFPVHVTIPMLFTHAQLDLPEVPLM